MHGIALYPYGVCSAVFCAGAIEHLGGEVESCYRLGALGALLQEGRCHVAGAAAEVQNAGVGAGEDVSEAARGAVPPAAVEAHGEQVIEQVVAGCDGVEDLAYLLCGVGFAGLACRSRAGVYALLGDAAHAVAPAEIAVLASRTICVAASSSSDSVTAFTTAASPIPTGRTKERAPLRFFLSFAVRATRSVALAVKGCIGP